MLNALVGRHSNIILGDGVIIAAVNEVVNLIDNRTYQIIWKIHHPEAENGFVTALALFNSSILAIGYSKGIVLVYDLNQQDPLNAAIAEENVEYLHKFNSHSGHKEGV